MVLLGILYFLFAVAYFWTLRHLISIWDSKAKEPLPTAALCQNILSQCTLMVPFRNEEENLSLLLPHFYENLPPRANVCFVDDHSEDNGVAIVTQFIYKNNLQNWCFMPSKGHGKKAALATGIYASQSAIIITTDADVRINKGWLGHLIRPFQDPDLQLAAGPVMTTSGQGFFGQFQQIEWASIVLMTQVSFAKGKPLMCSGANLAFRKKAFIAVGGYDGNSHIPSGDDEFLLKKIARKFGVPSVIYFTSPLSLVKTHALKSPQDWVRQRARWASKWNVHKGQAHWLSAVALAIFSVLILLSIPLAFLSREFTLGMLFFLALRIKFEKEALGKVLNLYELEFSRPSWFLAGWIYPVLVLGTLPFAIFGKYTWKGRKN